MIQGLHDLARLDTGLFPTSLEYSKASCCWKESWLSHDIIRQRRLSSQVREVPSTNSAHATFDTPSTITDRFEEEFEIYATVVGLYAGQSVFVILESHNSQSCKRCSVCSHHHQAYAMKLSLIMNLVLNIYAVPSRCNRANVAFPALELFGFPISLVIQPPILLTSSKSTPVSAPRLCRQ